MTYPKWIEPRVTMGNIVTVFVTAIMLVISYTNLQATVTQTSAELVKTNARIAENTTHDEATQQVLSGRIDTLRDAAMTRQEAIVARLARIEAILERVEKNSK